MQILLLGAKEWSAYAVVKLLAIHFAAEACKDDGGWLDAHRPAPGRTPQQSFRIPMPKIGQCQPAIIDGLV